MSRRIAFALLAAALAVGAAAAGELPGWFRLERSTSIDGRGRAGVQQVLRYHDEELGVTCWLTEYSRYSPPGISCIPDSQLKR
jgi:hypothetical protein